MLRLLHIADGAGAILDPARPEVARAEQGLENRWNRHRAGSSALFEVRCSFPDQLPVVNLGTPTYHGAVCLYPAGMPAPDAD